MAIQFGVPDETAYRVISIFRQHGFVAPEAELDPARIPSHRTAVSAGDFDFLRFAGMVGDATVALAAVRRPARIVGIGTYCGYMFSWLVGPSLVGPSAAERIVAVDIDEEAVTLSRDNFERAGISPVEHLCQDAFDFARESDETFDLICLDGDSPAKGKSIYLPLAKALYPRLAPGGWLLAHDTTSRGFVEQVADYLEYAWAGVVCEGAVGTLTGSTRVPTPSC